MVDILNVSEKAKIKKHSDAEIDVLLNEVHSNRHLLFSNVPVLINAHDSLCRAPTLGSAQDHVLLSFQLHTNSYWHKTLLIRNTFAKQSKSHYEKWNQMPMNVC